MFDYISLNRLDEAKATYEQALEHKLKSSFFHLALYQIAFLQNDAAGMAQQVAGAAGKPGLEDTLFANEADTAAYSGRLRSAREFSRQAVDSAERAGDKEAAATYSALVSSAGSLVRQRRRSTTACHFGNEASGRPRSAVRYRACLGLCRGRRASAKTYRRFGPDGSRKPQSCSSITCQPSAQSLRSAREMLLRPLRLSEPPLPYELGRTTYSSYVWTALYPVYVRGEAYLAAHQGKEAAAEFQKILDHRGIVLNGPIGALAHLQLGRAYALQGDTAKAKAAYQDFLTLWKDADPDIPILKEAKAEYAKQVGGYAAKRPPSARSNWISTGKRRWVPESTR